MLAVRIAAGAEVVTGLALVAAPSLFTRAIFGAPMTEPGEALGRLAGISLLALAVACWPEGRGNPPRAARALLAFGACAALFLVAHALAGGPTGFLLWPAALGHVGMSAALARLPGKASPAADPKGGAP